MRHDEHMTLVVTPSHFTMKAVKVIASHLFFRSRCISSGMTRAIHSRMMTWLLIGMVNKGYRVMSRFRKHNIGKIEMDIIT
jgi:hypothetical protein